MPKPDPALLDPARYPFHVEIQPRFGDLDVNMHINNVALARILEEGRVRFHHSTRSDRVAENVTSMAVSFTVEYLHQARHPDPLQVCVAATAIGRTSYTLCQLVIQQGRPVAWAQTVLVCVRENRPVEIPGFLESIKPWMLRE